MDALFIHVFVGGFALNFDISSMSEIAKAAGKPVFCFLLGRQEEAREFGTGDRAAGDSDLPGTVSGRGVHGRGVRFGQSRRAQKALGFPGVRSFAFRKMGRDHGAEQKARPLTNISPRRCSRNAGFRWWEKTVSSAEEAGAAASDLGFPVVMKGLAPGAVHKSEAGLVRLDIRSGDEAQGHFEELRAIVGEEGEGSGSEADPRGESELIVGMIRDPQFGPCVMCGLGGLLAEALGDAMFATAP